MKLVFKAFISILSGIIFTVLFSICPRIFKNNLGAVIFGLLLKGGNLSIYIYMVIWVCTIYGGLNVLEISF